MTDARRVLLTVPVDAAAEVVAGAGQLHAAGVIDRYTLGPASLEDAYLAVTGHVDDASGAEVGIIVDASVTSESTDV